MDTNARMRQMVGTPSDWSLNDLIIGDGEIAFERDGSTIKAKLGNGALTYTQLPYFAGNDLWNKSGTYTYSVTDGPVVVGATSGPDRFTVRGGDFTAGIYREDIPTDGQTLGAVNLGALEQGDSPVPGALIRAVSVGDWSPTNHGALLRFVVCAENETTPTVAGYVYSDGGVVWGDAAGGSQGPGTINAKGFSVDGTPVVMIAQSDFDEMQAKLTALVAAAIDAGWSV